MALVTAEERQRQIEERETLKNAPERERERLEEDLRINLSVAERLMRRADNPRFTTTFDDDLGTFEVESRLMTSSEILYVAKLNQQLAATAGDPKKYKEAMNEFKEMAKSVTTTPGMDAWYDSDGRSDDVVVAVVLDSFNGSMGLVGTALTSFRKE